MGWVQKSRNKGGIIFVDLRDRTGILQIIFEENDCGAESFAKAEKLRSEFVIAVTGRVEARSGAVNENLKTGAIEVRAESLRILSESETPPFPIEENSKTKEELRLKYRFLDLRRPDIQRNLILRSQIAILTRQFLAEEGFLEIETPTLIKSTPEGARDYLVPSRVHPGSFYALPQSPQLFKQLLMCSGYDRYFQMARCYRDEDLRADRQPEFTQIDMETFLRGRGRRHRRQRAPAAQAVSGTAGRGDSAAHPADDLERGYEPLRLRQTGHPVRHGTKGRFRRGEELRLRRIYRRAGKRRLRPRHQRRGTGRDAQKEDRPAGGFRQRLRRKGPGLRGDPRGRHLQGVLCQIHDRRADGGASGAMDGKPGDLLLFAADKNQVVWAVLGDLRLELARQQGLLKKDDFKFLWVTEFPLLEYSEEQGPVRGHAPSVHHADGRGLAPDRSDPGAVRAKAYDIVLNGTELGGGSVRIHQSDIQSKMFEVLGFTPERANEQFGFLLEAFKYGVPPHAGLAYGIDRVAMLMVGADSIRDVIAFPKVKDASCLMTEAPTPVDPKQLKELGIEVSQQSEE